MTEFQDQFEVIAAFADGERVDSQALRAALSAEAGRDYLIELVAMREIVINAEGASGDQTIRSSRDAGNRVRYRALTGLAAALAMAVGLGGYAIGRQGSQVVTVAVHPPLEADVVVSLEAPPAPTQVIPLGTAVKGSGGR